jgi:hypothetical protein
MEAGMNWITKAVYTKGAGEEAVNLARAGRCISSIRRVFIPLETVTNWMRAANAGQLSEAGKYRPAASEAELDLARVRRELAEVTTARVY